MLFALAPGLDALTLAFLIFGLVFIVTFVVLAVIGFVVTSIPKSWGVILSLAVLIVGLVLFMPGIDFWGLMGLLFIYYPGNRRMLAVGK